MKMLLIGAVLASFVGADPGVRPEVADLTWTDIVARLEKGAATSDASALRSAIADA